MITMSDNVQTVEINKDLANERLKCNFDVQEVTHIIDGGPDCTLQRKKIENISLNSGGWKDEIPEDYLSYKEKYENALRKSCIYSKMVKDEVISMTGLETFSSPHLRRTADAYFKEISPFLLHMGMFLPAILGHCTPEQQADWLPRALDMQIIGTYAQTELGHGTFIRGLETTATYDPETEEFVLNTPTLTAHKWWAGGLGKTVNHCVVLAQLYTKGKCHGIHQFMVQIRDLETHIPLPGIRVGEIGPKMSFGTADNGFLGFDNFRIPRYNMMMKNAQVEKDGTYVTKAKHGKMAYGTMILIRVNLVNEAAFNVAKAITIAVRYSAIRRQSQPKPNEPEPQVLDYLTQQHKLFICIATSHALQISSRWLWNTYTNVMAALKQGDVDALPELHALSSCMKAVSTSDSSVLIEQCRFACGGHGYMLSSNLPSLYAFVSAARTYEGEYTILMLQTARFLVKAWEQAEAGEKLTPTISYLNQKSNVTHKWDNSPEGIIKSFETVAEKKISSCMTNIRQLMKADNSYEDAWQLTTVRLVAAAEAHCRAIIIKVYWNEIVRLTSSSSPNVRTVMYQLLELYMTYWALEKSGDLLRYTSVAEEDLNDLQRKYEKLLTLIRPNAVGLVDAFDIRDEVLNSTLGAYDGRVYERLMAEALKSPLNAQPVNDSFHKYLKPLMQGKL